MFDGNVVAITGGAGGIGAAIARAFAEVGAKIALLDLDAEALERVAHSLADTASEVHPLVCDITNTESVDNAIVRSQERFGRLDILVHCAGLTHVSPFIETELDVYRRVMEVNFFGTIGFTKAALPMLIASRGQIIVLSSIAGVAPVIGRTGYCASKYSLHGFFEVLRAELQDQGVHVMLVCPSFVDTDFARSGLAGDGSTLTFERSTTGSLLTPETVARSILAAARKRKPLVVLSFNGKLVYWVARLFPNIYQRAMSRRFHIELERNKPPQPG